MRNLERKINYSEVVQSWQAHFLRHHRCCNMGDMSCPNISEHIGIARFFAARSAAKHLSLEDIEEIYAREQLENLQKTPAN